MTTEIVLPSRHKLDQSAVDHVMKQLGVKPQSMVLISKSALPALISGLDEAVIPAEKEQAKRAAEVLLGSYPRHAVEDPAIYSRGIVSVLNSFPAHVGAKAVDRLTLKSKFLPTRAELNEQCEAIMGELNAARAIARCMVQEHERREKEQRDEADRAKSRQEFRDKHGDKSPMDVLKAEGITIGGNSKKEKT